MSTADLVLHPVRLRILQAFLGGRHLTTGDLARELPDVAQAGLYRHVGRLADGGVLEVVRERPVRGAIERTYALRQENAWVDPGTFAALGREGQAVAFATFAASLMAAYGRYLAAGETDPVRDGVSYSMNALWLTDEEHLDFLLDVAKIVAPRAANGPAPGRRRRLAASAFFPVPGTPTTGSPATGSPATGSTAAGAAATGSAATGPPTANSSVAGSATTGTPAAGSAPAGSPATGSTVTGSFDAGLSEAGSPATGEDDE